MWADLAVVSIAMLGTVFMVWFLTGMLRDGKPSVCYLARPVIHWLLDNVPTGRRTRIVALCDETKAADSWEDAERHLLENAIYGQESYDSDAVAVGDRDHETGIRLRTIQGSGIHILRHL